MDNHLVAGEIHGQMNLLFGALLIAIVKRVDDAFAYAHTDFVAIVLAKAGSLGYPETHLLSEIDAFDLRLQRDFEVLGVCAHARTPWRRQVAPNRAHLSVTQRLNLSQWST